MGLTSLGIPKLSVEIAEKELKEFTFSFVSRLELTRCKFVQFLNSQLRSLKLFLQHHLIAL